MCPRSTTLAVTVCCVPPTTTTGRDLLRLTLPERTRTDRTWLRADAGGFVDVRADRGALVAEGDRIATITNPFRTDNTPVRAPFTGPLVGVAENPLVYPGNPLCHPVRIDEPTRRAIEASEGRERAG